MACFRGHDRGRSISRCLYDKWPLVATNWICSSVRLADQLGKLILHGCILTYGNCSSTVTVGFCTKWQIVDSFSSSCKQNCCTTILITIDVLHRFTSYHLLQGTRHNPSYHDRSMCYNSPWPCPFTPLSSGYETKLVCWYLCRSSQALLKALVWFWWIDETLSANLVYQKWLWDK